MDEKTRHTSAWLAFTLAFDASASLCQKLANDNVCTSELANLIASYRQGQTTPLEKACQGIITPEKLQTLSSEAINRRVAQALDWQRSEDHYHLISFDQPDYPSALIDTINAPPLLYAKGNLSALRQPALAIVGSRKASRTAIDLSYTLAKNLAHRGVCIVSGLARGIDAAAHEGALAAGGKTIAVAATEPESVYPKQHADLASRIIGSGGLIVTEYPLGAPTLKWYFPRRNRIISGLSLGVLVSEAGLPSGTLTTATHAIEQGREVMAVPGSVNNPQARGCHALIKQGATLVECEDDILDALASPLLRCLTNQPEPADNGNQASLQLEDSIEFKAKNPIEAQVLASLAVSPATLDELMTDVHCSVAELSTLLGLMEIDGAIASGAGGRYSRL